MKNKQVALQALYVSYIMLPIVSFYVNSGIRILLAAAILATCLQRVGVNILKVLPLYLIPLFTETLAGYKNGGISFTTLYFYFNLYMISLIGINLSETQISKNTFTFSKIVILFMSITCLTTIIGNVIFPGASRVLAGIGDQIDLFNQYMKYNISGFDFVYTVTIIFPLVICMTRILPKKTAGVLLSFLIAGVIIQTGYGFATLLFLATMVLFLGDKKKTLKNIRKLMLFLAFLLLISQSLLPYLLTYIAQYIPSEEVAIRFNDLSVALSGNEVEDNSDLLSRKMQYQISINGFLSNPIFGKLSNRSGGHSFLLDTLCRFGLIGGALFVYFITQAYRLYIKPFKNEFYFGYLLFSFFLFIVCLVINPQPNIMVVSFIYPIFTRYLNIKHFEIR